MSWFGQNTTKYIKCTKCTYIAEADGSNESEKVCPVCGKPLEKVDVSVDGHDGINSDFVIVRDPQHPRDRVLTKYTGNSAKVIVPAGVTQIGMHAFAFSEHRAEIEEIVLPDGVEMISMGAFSGCVRLKKISIPETVGVIEDDAFLGCISLTDAVIPFSNALVSHKAFLGCDALRETWGKKRLCVRCGYKLRGLFKKQCDRCGTINK